MGREKQPLSTGWKAALLAAVIVIATMGAVATGAFQSTEAQEPPAPHPIAENSPAGSAVATPLSASASGGGVLYSLSGADAASFTINPQTGEISLAEGSSPDYEGQSTLLADRNRHNPSDHRSNQRRRARTGHDLQPKPQCGRRHNRKPVRPRRRSQQPRMDLDPV